MVGAREVRQQTASARGWGGMRWDGWVRETVVLVTAMGGGWEGVFLR